ncbi:MAG: putative redox protein [Flavobacteriaceae bacterium]|jgi:putative redox protein
MATAVVEYLGGLRTKCTHVKSGTEIITDAPTDNNGKGEAFSPTDLVATAYLSCMITIIGIYCNKHEIAFSSARGEVVKSMATEPRRINGLNVIIDFTGNDWDEKTQRKITAAAETCPVAQSVNGEMEISFSYKF